MSFKIAIGLSTRKAIPEAAQEAALKCVSQLPAPGDASLALVFSTPDFASAGLLKSIRQALKSNIPIIGCSAVNLITSEGIQKEGVIIALLSLANTKISCGLIETDKNKDPLSGAQELGTGLASHLKGQRRQFCLLFNDGLSENTSGLIKGLQSVLGVSFPFIGGGSSDNLKFRQTYQYYDTRVLNKGTICALLAGKLNFGLGIKHGWRPLGKTRVITESNGNIIKKIDGKNACYLYEDYFAKTIKELKKELLRISILYPIGVHLKGESEYLLRNIISLNDDGSITTQGDVPQGSSIRLMIATKESCLEAARQAALQVQVNLRDKKAEFALVISSASRAYLLGRQAHSEIKIIREILGRETPLFGFYSYGEYAPLGSINYYGQTYLHNQTIAILGIAQE